LRIYEIMEKDLVIIFAESDVNHTSLIIKYYSKINFLF